MNHKAKMNEPQYPSDICADCGSKAGRLHEFPVTYWNGKCGWCNREGSVTSPRDMGYPPLADFTNIFKDKPLDGIPNRKVENSEYYDSIECEEEDDGSLTLHIPDELVRRVMEFTIINALEGLVKEYEKKGKTNEE